MTANLGKAFKDIGTHIANSVMPQHAAEGLRVWPHTGYLRNIEGAPAVTLSFGPLFYGQRRSNSALSVPELAMTGRLDCVVTVPNDAAAYATALSIAASVAGWARGVQVYELTDADPATYVLYDDAGEVAAPPDGTRTNSLAELWAPTIQQRAPRYLGGALEALDVLPADYVVLTTTAEVDLTFDTPFNIVDSSPQWDDLNEVRFAVDVNGEGFARPPRFRVFNATTESWSDVP